ncbi:hypothetical protein F7725_018474 [Dissostichus mawsoni]|uniref:Uncharacterized protein n=1 Tax=Dissostichus mawsoni TaxID=36200 RepID=A0A7J5XT47_DISMA|nr:hypothetical protein F7725_018474 [Dissostichus mawsoni]
MKIAYVLLLLGVGVMSVVLFQAGRQEMKLINFRARMVDSEAETVREEHAIVELKTQLEQLKQTVMSMNINILNLRKKKQDIEQLTQDFTQSVQSCNMGHEEAKQKAAVEIQALKQQILDRDKLFVSLQIQPKTKRGRCVECLKL